MKLHLVIHHRQDPDQRFANSWLDDAKLEAITTTTEIGRLCKEAQENAEPVYIHRCGWGHHSPTVACSVLVTNVDRVDRTTALVKFSGQIVLESQPPVSPGLGQNYYFA